MTLMLEGVAACGHPEWERATQRRGRSTVETCRRCDRERKRAGYHGLTLVPATCVATRTGPKGAGQRCTNRAMEGSDYCQHHHPWEPGERGPAPVKLTSEGLVSLEALWYRSERVVDFIRNHLDADEETSLLTNGPGWVARRWYAIREAEPWTRLSTADKLLTHLHLSLYELGDPDVASSKPPAEAIRLGYSLNLIEKEAA